MKEIKKTIEDYPNYLISNLGKVYSLPNVSRSGIRVMKGSLDKDGYHVVTIRRDNKQFTLKIHRLVAKAFIKNLYNKPQINHIDENKSNNLVTNLEWVTGKENLTHSNTERWLKMRGEGNKNAILGSEDIREIRRLYKQPGFSRKRLADMYGVSMSLIEKIYYRVSWKHIL